jgi:DNA-binding LacI/PurR family transcriptional regulator
VDAVLALLASDGLRPLVAQLRAMPGFRDRPIVSMVWPTDNGSSILPDYALGAELATRHLLALGHRHLLHFGHADDLRYLWGYPQAQRLSGARRALVDAGLDPETHLRTHALPFGWMAPANIDAPVGAEDGALIAYLRAHPETTAILCWNDAVAIRTVHTLRWAGLHVPEDYSVIGFDDTDSLRGEGGENVLTSVRLPLAAIGAEAVRVAMQRTTGALPEDVTRVLPTELAVRGTTGPA